MVRDVCRVYYRVKSVIYTNFKLELWRGAIKLYCFKMFLSGCNDILIPVCVITTQETHFTHNTNLSFYEPPEYTLISDITCINN